MRYFKLFTFLLLFICNANMGQNRPIADYFENSSHAKGDATLISSIIFWETMNENREGHSDAIRRERFVSAYKDRIDVRKQDSTIIFTVIIKKRKNSQIRLVGKTSVKDIVGKSFDFEVAEVSISAIKELLNNPDILFIEPSYYENEQLNESANNIKANRVWIGGDVNQPLSDKITGKDVLIGIIDSKPNRNHQTFHDGNGNSRFQSYDNNGARKHGSHVAGIAAGRGTGTPPQMRGIAYESDLYWKPLGSSASTLISVQELIEHAGSKPLVINHSAGLYFGPRNGTTNYELALNSLIDGNKVFVNAAGNQSSNNYFGHLDGYVPENTPGFYEFEVMIEDMPNNTFSVEIWHNSAFDIVVSDRDRITNQDWSDTIRFGNTDVFNNYDWPSHNNYIKVYNSATNYLPYSDTLSHNNDASRVILIAYNDSTDNTIKSGRYGIRLFPHNNQGGHFDAYFNKEIRYGGFINGDNYQTITTPGYASEVITVSAHRKSTDGGNWAPYSSLGPSRIDNSSISKPDIAAPGGYTKFDNLFGIWSADSLTSNGYRHLQGTSMAAPHVTGAIALLMQYFPQLNALQVKDILQKSAGPIPSGHWQGNGTLEPEDRKYWGAGKLDILAAYQSMVGFDYTPLPASIVTKFKTSYNAGAIGLPIEPVVSSWGSPNYYKQKLTNGAIFLNDARSNACWLGEGIWYKWIEINSHTSFIGLPKANEAPDPYNNNFQTVYFDKGKIYWNGTEAIVCTFLPDFTASATAGSLPFHVQFTDSSVVQNAYPTAWLWDFGDGNTSTAQNPTHTYFGSGNYNVSLTIFDNEHSYTLTKSNYISTFSNQAVTNIVRIEYYFDADPGLGNGTPIAFTPSPYIDIEANLDLSTLGAGLHRLYIRTKDANGKWSALHSKPIYVSNQNALAQNISRIEYSFDSLAPEGLGTPLGITPSQDVSFSDTINLASISTGLHRIYFRARDASGKWGSVHSKPIYVNQKNTTGTFPDIARIEYSFDSISIPGNGLPLTLTSASDVTVNQNVNLSTIPTGLHRMYFRAKDTNGNWSSLHSKPIYVSNMPASPTDITRVEYSFDTLVEAGTGTPFVFSHAPDVTIEDFLNTTNLTDGLHKVYFRAGDANGNWSHPQTKDINLYDFSLIIPSNETTVTEDTIRFEWSTLAGITKYLLYVDNNSGFGSAEISSHHIDALKILTSNNFTISANWLPQNVYYWKVRAILGSDTIDSPVRSFTYRPDKLPAPYWVPLYRAYLPTDVDHFYCSSGSHLQTAINGNYQFEGVEGFVSLHPFETASPEDLSNIFRFYIPDNTTLRTKGHYYTTSEADKDNRIIQGWIYEGITGYAYSQPRAGLVPLYHNWLNIPNDRNNNFYTTSEFEKNNAISHFGYVYQGVTCYVSANGGHNAYIWQNDLSAVGFGINPVNGNLGHYEKDVFQISEGKTNLNFKHLYNSNAVRLFSSVKPLGNGWSHTYNASLITTEENVMVVWPDHIDLYNMVGLTAITPGLYDVLQQPNAEEYTITIKNQSVYKFSKILTSPLQNTYMLTSINDRFGNEVIMHYNDFGRLEYVKSPANRFIKFEYYPDDNETLSGLIKSVKDSLAINRTVQYQYDNQRNLISFTDAMGQITGYGYDSISPQDHFLARVNFPDGTTLNNTYDPESKRIIEQDLLSSDKSNYKTAIGLPVNNQVNVTDAIGNKTGFSFNDHGNITSLITANGSAEFHFDDSNNPTKPTKISDGMGFTTEISYDQKGNPLWIKKPLGIRHQYVWNSTNDLIRYTNPKGIETNYTYQNGKLTSVLKPRGTISFTHFGNGNIQTVTDPLSQTTTFAYDASNKLTQIVDNIGNTTSYEYDNAGKMTRSTDANEAVTMFSYNLNDWLTAVTDAHGYVTQYDYDEKDRLTTVTDAKNNTTSMTYNDVTGWIDQTTDQLGNHTVLDYFNNGLLQSVATRNGQTINHQYDSSNRLASTTSASLSRSFVYDDNDRLVQLNDQQGAITYVYDSINRLISYTDFYNNLVQYEYDKADNITKITYPGNKAVTYTYYDDDLLHTVTDWIGNTSSYTYRNDGSVQRVDLPNGTYTTYVYDDASRMTGLSNRMSDNSIISEYSFTLDANGNHLEVMQQEPMEMPLLDEAEINYTYDNANRILTAGAITYGHDLNGNLTLINNDGDLTNFTYDVEDRLTAITGSENASYIYDGLGNRRAAIKSGTSIRYVLDINSQLDKVIVETDAANNALYYYIHGEGLLYRIKASDNSVQYYHYDSRGSTIAITNAGQEITHKYVYDDFGLVLNKIETDFNTFRYVGKYGVMFEDSLLFFMRARYYRPDIGRFTSEDPVWDFNLYLYAKNNSLIYIDPLGLSAWDFISKGMDILGGIFKIKSIGVNATSNPSGSDAISTVFEGTKVAASGLAVILNDNPRVKEDIASNGATYIEMLGGYDAAAEYYLGRTGLGGNKKLFKERHEAIKRYLMEQYPGY